MDLSEDEVAGFLVLRVLGDVTVVDARRFEEWLVKFGLNRTEGVILDLGRPLSVAEYAITAIIGLAQRVPFCVVAPGRVGTVGLEVSAPWVPLMDTTEEAVLHLKEVTSD